MISKLSLYDLFAMVIPGGIIIAAIWPWLDLELPFRIEELCCGSKVVVENKVPGWVWVVFTIAAYFVGLINNWISDGVSRGFRNNTNIIENALQKVLRDNENIHLQDYGIMRHNVTAIEIKGLCQVLKEVSKDIYKHWLKDGDTVNSPLYYWVYYKLYEQNLLSSIPILEAQVALIRNCLIPIAILTLSLGFKLCWWFAASLLIMLIALFVVMVQRQNKVYQMVWEAANYYEL